MKFYGRNMLRSFVVLVSMIWLTEDVVRFIFPTSHFIVASSEQSNEGQIHFELDLENEKIWIQDPEQSLTSMDAIGGEFHTNIYQEPHLSSPEVPPEHWA